MSNYITGWKLIFGSCIQMLAKSLLARLHYQLLVSYSFTLRCDLLNIAIPTWRWSSCPEFIKYLKWNLKTSLLQWIIPFSILLILLKIFEGLTLKALNCFYKKLGGQRVFSIWIYHKCLSWLFPIHLNTCYVSTAIINNFNLTVLGSTLDVRIWRLQTSDSDD